MAGDWTKNRQSKEGRSDLSNLVQVTITGADDRTDISKLLDLSKRYSFVEWGILLSQNNAGWPRFPGQRWIQELAELQEGERKRINLSLHLCGAYVRGFLAGLNPARADHPAGWDVARRVQLNFHGMPHVRDDKAFVSRLVERPSKQFIFQMDGTQNRAHFQFAADSGIGVSPFFDTSGGKGKLPDQWPKAEFKPSQGLSYYPGFAYHGYAGGLGPDNIEAQLPRIAEAAGEARFWIDMEGQMRTRVNPSSYDTLDMDKVERVLEICQRYMVGKTDA